MRAAAFTSRMSTKLINRQTPIRALRGDYLPTYTWCDLALGALSRRPREPGEFQKYRYDGVGRLIASYDTSYDTDELSLTGSDAYDAALTVDNDTVLQQTDTWYDAADESVASATYQRLPGDIMSTGELTAANSYATASATWYDAIGRTVATADYGREDVAANSAWARYVFHRTSGSDAGGSYSAGDLIDANRNNIPDVAEAAPAAAVTPPPRPVRRRGINFQLQLVEYDTAGRAYRTKDNLGRISQTVYDAAGRTVRTIQNV